MNILTYPEEEKSVLGSCLISKDSAYQVMQLMRPEYFSCPINQKIFEFQRNIYLRSETLSREALRVEALEGDFYQKHKNVFLLLGTYADINNLNAYIHKIKTSYSKRLIAECLRRLSNNLDEVHIDEIAEICHQYTTESVEKTTFYEEDLLSNFEEGKSYIDVLQERQERYDSGIRLTGYSTGFKELDEKIQGLNKGHYIVIGGTPGSGKTSLAVQMIRNLENQKIKVGVLTLELSNSQLIDKLMSTRTGISYSDLTKGKISSVQFHNCVDEVMPRMQENRRLLAFEEIPVNSLAALKSRISRLVEVEKIQVLVIDYISLIDTGESKSNATDRLTKISICIKDLLKKYKIPGIVLVQLVKNVENTPPDKYHIKDASQIIQDAFEILMLHNPDSQDDTSKRRDLYIRKARFGSQAKIGFYFNGVEFSSLSEYHRETERQVQDITENINDFISNG